MQPDIISCPSNDVLKIKALFGFTSTWARVLHDLQRDRPTAILGLSLFIFKLSVIIFGSVLQNPDYFWSSCDCSIYRYRSGN